MVNGQTKTKQNTKQVLLDKHCDIFLQDFINNCFNGAPNTNIINKNNVYYFANNEDLLNNFRYTVDSLLAQTIESYLISLGYEKDKDYEYAPNNKIKTNPVVFIKILSAYDFNRHLAQMLQNVLVY